MRYCLKIRAIVQTARAAAGLIPGQILLCGFAIRSKRRKQSSCLVICGTFLRFRVFGCVELRHQILIAGRTHAGAAGCVTAALAFLLLLRLNDFSKIVAVFLPENAGNLAVFPEKAATAGLGLVAVILDSIDQNDVRFDVFLLR